MAAPDRRFIFMLTVAQRRLQRHVEQQLSQHGLTAAQSGVLFWLGEHDGALIGDVADGLDIVPSAMTGLVDRMVRAGLVARIADDQDGRSVRIRLTAAGRALRSRAAALTRSLNASLVEGFSDAEADVISRWLTSVQARFAGQDEIPMTRARRGS